MTVDLLVCKPYNLVFIIMCVCEICLRGRGTYLATATYKISVQFNMDFNLTFLQSVYFEKWLNSPLNIIHDIVKIND